MLNSVLALSDWALDFGLSVTTDLVVNNGMLILLRILTLPRRDRTPSEVV